jgi:fused signal recognition particle receptor
MNIFKFLKSDAKNTPDEVQQEGEYIQKLKQEAEAKKLLIEEPLQSKITLSENKSFFGKLKRGLQKTSSKFGGSIGNLLLGKKVIDDDLIDDIEMQLITADIGIEATTKVMDSVRAKVSRNELQTMDALVDLLKSQLLEIILPSQKTLNIQNHKSPYVILMVGINGAGKTTTIGKLAYKFIAQGHSVMLAAGDTFRAAAVEQLQAWGGRNNVPVVSQHTGADCASVIYDAIQSAKAKNIDIVIADTAGRLHTKGNLMEELKKVIRVTKKLIPEAPHEVMLVLDASIGQNAMVQAEEFKSAVDVSGITLTKMDGTAKGGVIFAISQATSLPVRYIGIGEGQDDLKDFNAKDFVDALFADA